MLAACKSDHRKESNVPVVERASVPVSAWIGRDDTLLSFAGNISGFSLYRSGHSHCQVSSDGVCRGEQLGLLKDGTVTDTAATWTSTAYYTLTHENQKATLELRAASAAEFAGRALHELVVWQDRLWLIAGHTSAGDSNDLWSSRDGIHWQLETANAAFSPRAGHQVVVYKNRLWLIGGSSNGKIMNDVWSSKDGINWSLEAADAGFSPRAYHQVVVYRDQLWLVGGRTGTLANKNGELVGMANDVWSSGDGIHWLQQSAQAAFLPRMTHHLIVYRNQLWLMGGFNMSDFGEVWSSQDGINWTEVAKAEFGFRNHSTLVAYDDRLWMIGGSTLDRSQGGDSALRSDVWSSSDGIHWQQRTAEAGFDPRWGLRAVNFKQQIMVIGGDLSSGAKGVAMQGQNDIWSTSNGTDWRLGFAGRFEFH
ncbi:MAG TPA: hypothetical protein VN030_09475 [Cellvibrio sp.]|nr:hypothetical protein [Cellvibrio sp.]